MSEQDKELIQMTKDFIKTLTEIIERHERLEAVHIVKPVSLRYGERFWVVDGYGLVKGFTWRNEATNAQYAAIGNCFQTELEAKRHAAKMKFMFRRCPEIEDGEEYFIVGHGTETGTPAVANYINANKTVLGIRSSFGGVFKTSEEAQEWQPLYKFAFLGGDCPEGF